MLDYGEDAAIMQRHMEIIGQVVFRVNHLQLVECNGPTGFEKCYPKRSLTKGGNND